MLQHTHSAQKRESFFARLVRALRLSTARIVGLSDKPIALVGMNFYVTETSIEIDWVIKDSV